MLVLASSRIPRSALLSSLTILSLATFAHASVPTALGTSTPLDESGKIIGIIGGIMGIIGGGGIVGFVTWLRRVKSDWIREAVKQANEECEKAVTKLRHKTADQLINMASTIPTIPRTPKEEEQSAKEAQKNLMAFDRGE